MVGLPPFNTPNLDGQAINNRCGGTTYEVTSIDYTVDTSNLESIAGAEEASLDFRFGAGIPKLGKVDPSISPAFYEKVFDTLSETVGLSEELAGAYTDAISDAGESVKDSWGEFTDAVRDGDWSGAAGAGSDIISSARSVGDNISDTLTDIITNTDAFGMQLGVLADQGIAQLKAAAGAIGANMASKISGGVFYDGSVSIKVDVKFTKRFFEEQIKKFEYLNQQVCLEVRADGSFGFELEIDHNKMMDPKLEAEIAAGIYAVISGDTLDSMGMQVVAGVYGTYNVFTGEPNIETGVWVENK